MGTCIDDATKNVCKLRIIKPGIFWNSNAEPLNEEEKTENLCKAVLRVLGLLSGRNFCKFVCFMKELTIDTKERMEKIADIFLDEAIKKGVSLERLALMFTFFQRIEVSVNNDPDCTQKITFREIFIEKCEKRFIDLRTTLLNMRIQHSTEIENQTDVERRNFLSVKLKKKLWQEESKSSGVVELISKLLEKKVFSSERLLCFIKTLMSEEEESSYKGAAVLIRRVGRTLEKDLSPSELDPIYDQLRELLDVEKKANISPRTRRLIKEVVENRRTTELNRQSFMKVHRILCKWPPENLDESSLMELPIDNLKSMEIIVEIILCKAVYDSRFIGACAQLCDLLQTKEVSDSGKNGQNCSEKITFLEVLLNQCEKNFESLQEIKRKTDLQDSDLESNVKLLGDSEEEKCYRKRVVNLVRFICELSKKQLITCGVLMNYLMSLTKKNTDFHYECLCEFLKSRGELLENIVPKSDLDLLFRTVKDKVEEETVVNMSERVRSLLQEVIDLRENQWVLNDVDCTSVTNETAESALLVTQEADPIIQELQELVDLEKRGGCLSPKVRCLFQEVLKKWTKKQENMSSKATESVEEQNNKTSPREKYRKFFKTVHSVLKTVTPENFVEYLSILLHFPIHDCDDYWAYEIGGMTFSQIVFQPEFSEACAQMCVLLDRREEVPDSSGPYIATKDTLGYCVVNSIFNLFDEYTCERLKANEEEMKKLRYETDLKKKYNLQKNLEARNLSLRKGALSMTRFMCELTKIKMRDSDLRTILNILCKLLAENKDMTYECANEFLTSLGPTLAKDLPKETDEVFEVIKKVVGTGRGPNLSHRVRCLLQDLLDLRENNWVPLTNCGVRKTADVESPLQTSLYSKLNQSSTDRNLNNTNWRASEVKDTAVSKAELFKEVRKLTVEKKERPLSVRQVFKKMSEEQVRKLAQAQENANCSAQPSDDKSVETSFDADFFMAIRSILNKLTPQNFHKLTSVVNDIPFDTESKVRLFVDAIFIQIIEVPKFQEIVVQMIPQIGAYGHIRKTLISRVQFEFENGLRTDSNKIDILKILDDETDPAKRKELLRDLENEKNRFRRRYVAIAGFIGELFKKRQLTIRIVIRCLNNLLAENEDVYYESLCTLLKNIGARLENRVFSCVFKDLDAIFEVLQRIVDKKDKTHFSSRMRFIIQDVIELRENKWIPRISSADVEINVSLSKQQEQLPSKGKNSKLSSETPPALQNWRSRT